MTACSSCSMRLSKITEGWQSLTSRFQGQFGAICLLPCCFCSTRSTIWGQVNIPVIAHLHHDALMSTPLEGKDSTWTSCCVGHCNPACCSNIRSSTGHLLWVSASLAPANVLFQHKPWVAAHVSSNGLTPLATPCSVGERRDANRDHISQKHPNQRSGSAQTIRSAIATKATKPSIRVTPAPS